MDKIETLHDLCDTLSEELADVNEKIRKAGGMSAGDLETVDKLSHALKSIKTTIAMMESGYSQAAYPYNDGRIYSDGRGGSYRGGSYAGRRGNVRRDSMGRYSRDDGELHEMLDELRGMDMPEEKRRKVDRLISEIER